MMMKNKNILIVEDEPTLSKILTSYFTKANFEVFAAKDGEEAINIFSNTKIDIVILDIMLPKIDGFEVAKRIRSTSNVPIIATTALGEEQDMIKGYSLKIDDYINKPYNPKILVMKVNNLLQRLESPEDTIQTYTVGALKLDFGNYKVFVDDKDINVSKTEFKLLAFLIQNKNKACSRNLLLDEIWGLDVFVDIRIVDTYIKNLRKLIKPYDYIKTIFGVGYQFQVEDIKNEEKKD